MIEKLDFLLGTWRLDYRVPESRMSGAMTGSGTGTFRKALGGRYVFFEYEAAFSEGSRCQALGIFAEDPAGGILRYWWFEDSGSFMTASCRFEEDGALAMKWDDTLLAQSFRKTGAGTVILEMSRESGAGAFETVMTVLMTRQALERV